MARIEVCTGSLQDSITAWEAGASRIELNAGLETGGLTPSSGIVRAVLEEVSIPVVVMVRPRSGGFLYSQAEKKAMLHDAEAFLSLGASGIVFGSLVPGGLVDADFAGEMRRLAGKREAVFHRAFDLAADKFSAAAVLSDTGIDRVLTSGGADTAWSGKNTIRDLVSMYGHSIEILPGSRINLSNALELVRFTRCRWVHGSFTGPVTGEPRGILPSAFPGPSPDEIRAVKALLESIQ
jgi:copper homeostasis protein